MNGPGFLRVAGLVALKDLRLEWRTWETLASTLVFSLIVLVVYNFAFGWRAVAELGASRLVPGVLWTVIAFAAVVGMSRSAQIERRHGALSALFLAPVDRSALYLGKALANGVKLGVVTALIVPLTALFFDYDLLAVAPSMALVLLVHGIGLTELGTLFAAVTTRVGRGEALLATLLFPAATPLLISAVESTSALLRGDSVGVATKWLQIAAVFDLLYLMVALATFEFVLEE